eukprot:UN16685
MNEEPELGIDIPFFDTPELPKKAIKSMTDGETTMETFDSFGSKKLSLPCYRCSTVSTDVKGASDRETWDSFQY